MMIDGYEEPSKADLLETLRSEWAAWNSLVERVGTRIDESGVEGEWSVKDVIAHITAYERLLLGALGGAVPTLPDPPATVDMAEVHQRNAWFHSLDRQRAAEEILRDSTTIHQRLLDAIEARSESEIHKLRVYPWSDRPLWREIVGETFDHYRQHVGPLRDWLGEPQVSGSIRPATTADVPAILDIAEAKREEYQRYQPTFWRKAGDSREKHRPHLESLVENERVICRVHETDGLVDGFIFVSLVPAPPVYDPGGPVCLVDDFATKDPSGWDSFGAALLDDVIVEAKQRGAILAVVIAGHVDQPKRAMLAGVGYQIASAWHTKEL
jgi:hypothetical protein